MSVQLGTCEGSSTPHEKEARCYRWTPLPETPYLQGLQDALRIVWDEFREEGSEAARLYSKIEKAIHARMGKI